MGPRREKRMFEYRILGRFLQPMTYFQINLPTEPRRDMFTFKLAEKVREGLEYSPLVSSKNSAYLWYMYTTPCIAANEQQAFLDHYISPPLDTSG